MIDKSRCISRNLLYSWIPPHICNIQHHNLPPQYRISPELKIKLYQDVSSKVEKCTAYKVERYTSWLNLAFQNPDTYHYALVNSEKDLSVVSAVQMGSGQRTVSFKCLISNNNDFNILLTWAH